MVIKIMVNALVFGVVLAGLSYFAWFCSQTTSHGNELPMFLRILLLAVGLCLAIGVFIFMFP